MANVMKQSVVIYTKCSTSVTADDAVVKGQGTAAAGALENHRDIYIDDGTKVTYIPFESVCYAEITKTMSQEADPQDDICPEPAP